MVGFLPYKTISSLDVNATPKARNRQLHVFDSKHRLNDFASRTLLICEMAWSNWKKQHFSIKDPSLKGCLPTQMTYILAISCPFSEWGTTIIGTIFTTMERIRCIHSAWSLWKRSKSFSSRAQIAFFCFLKGNNFYNSFSTLFKEFDRISFDQILSFGNESVTVFVHLLNCFSSLWNALFVEMWNICHMLAPQP